MPSRFLEPSSAGLRQPTDPNKENGRIINPPRFADKGMGGLTSPKKIAATNNLTIKKPGGR